jgi:RNA polymerase sigma-70 factor (ECF subfamily)
VRSPPRAPHANGTLPGQDVTEFDPSTSDGTLVAAAVAGEREAFALLVRRYQGPLLRAAISRLGNVALAEETVQETMLCSLKWLHSYDSRYSFRTWLWTILLRQCARQGKREARQGGPRLSGPAMGGETAVEPLCSAPSPLDKLLVGEDAQRLHALLSRLPEVQADALRLRFFGELTFPEIAAAMECSESGAKNRVKLGLIQLSHWLRETQASRAAENLPESDARRASAVTTPDRRGR